MPVVTLETLTRQLAERRLAPVYVLVGEDVKLVDRMVDGIEATVDEADRPFAVDRLYAGDAGGDPVAIVAAARLLPMLGSRRVVIVLRAERLLKPKRGGRAGEGIEDDADGEGEPLDLEPLVEYLAAPVDSTTLVFVAAAMDRTRRLAKQLVAQAVVVEFGGLAADLPAARREGRRTATEWLEDELIRAGRGIDPDAARLLVARAGHDITKLRGDVERLLLFSEGRKRVTVDDVIEVVAEHDAVDDDWAVVNALADGDAARALREAGRRLDRGDSPHQLLGQLRWWVSTRLAEGDPARVKPALELLLRTDLALKSSGGEERVLVERLVAELVGRPLPQRGWGGRR